MWLFDSDRRLAEAIDRKRINLGNRRRFFPFEMLFRPLNSCIIAGANQGRRVGRLSPDIECSPDL